MHCDMYRARLEIEETLDRMPQHPIINQRLENVCVLLLTMFSAETRVPRMVKGNLRVDERRQDVFPH